MTGSRRRRRTANRHRRRRGIPGTNRRRRRAVQVESGDRPHVRPETLRGRSIPERSIPERSRPGRRSIRRSENPALWRNPVSSAPSGSYSTISSDTFAGERSWIGPDRQRIEGVQPRRGFSTTCPRIEATPCRAYAHPQSRHARRAVDRSIVSRSSGEDHRRAHRMERRRSVDLVHVLPTTIRACPRIEDQELPGFLDGIDHPVKDARRGSSRTEPCRSDRAQERSVTGFRTWRLTVCKNVGPSTAYRISAPFGTVGRSHSVPTHRHRNRPARDRSSWADVAAISKAVAVGVDLLAIDDIGTCAHVSHRSPSESI